MNYYCDESCHLLKDNSQFMVIGALYCASSDAKRISLAIRRIKVKHGLSEHFEIKSTKISTGNINFYAELVDFFLNEDTLFFRTIIIDKTTLDHRRFNQTHDEWYYKMYYQLIRNQTPNDAENLVFMDLKDVHSGRRCLKLQQVLGNSVYNIMRYRVVPIDSKYSNIIQLADMLIGLVCYNAKGLKTSSSKLQLIESIENTLNIDISNTNYNTKFNVFRWRGGE